MNKDGVHRHHSILKTLFFPNHLPTARSERSDLWRNKPSTLRLAFPA